MEVSVFWVVDQETDRIVGSAHTRGEARVMVTEHDTLTHHHSHIRRVMMDEGHVHHDLSNT